MAGPSDKDVSVTFGAETEDLAEGTERARSYVAQFADRVEESATASTAAGVAIGNTITEMMEKVREFLSESITAFGKVAEEVRKMSYTFGESAQDMSGVRLALDDANMSAEGYIGILTRLTMRLRTNRDEFIQLGIDITTPQKALLGTIAYLDKMSDAQERNELATKLLGRGWRDLADLSLLTNERIEEGAQLAEEFGLTLSKDDVQAARAFQIALNDLRDIVEGFRVVLGRYLYPALTDLMVLLKDIGVPVFDLFRVTVGALILAFDSLVVVLRAVWEAIRLVVILITTGLTAAVDALVTLVTQGPVAAYDKLKVAGSIALESMHDGWGRVRTSAEGASKAFGDYLSNFGKGKGRDEWSDPGDVPGWGMLTGKDGGRGGKDGKAAKAKPDDLYGEWTKQLQVMRDAADDFRGLDKATEEQFWTDKLAIAQGNTDLYMKVFHSLREVQKKDAQEQLSEALKTLDWQKEAARENKDEIVRIEQAKVALLTAAEGEYSRKTLDAQRQLARAEREAIEQHRRDLIAQFDLGKTLDDIELSGKQEHLAFLRQLGAISEQEEIRGLQELAAEKYNLDRLDLLRKIEASGEKIEEQRRYYAELLKLDAAYRNQVASLERKGSMESIKWLSSSVDAVQGGISTAIKGIIQGTTTLSQAFKNMAQTILLSFVDLGIKMVADWIKRKVMLMAAEKAFAAEKVALDTSTAAASSSIGLIEGLKQIGNLAAQAAAGAYEATAAIPYVGPILAPAAAAAAFAGTMVFGGMLSAESGAWDIPGGAVLTHPREAVLPADIRAGLENLITHGGNSAPINLHVHAMDSQDVARFLKRHGPAVMDSVRGQLRNFRGFDR